MPPRVPRRAPGCRTVWPVPMWVLTRAVRFSASASPICTVPYGRRRIRTLLTNDAGPPSAKRRNAMTLTIEGIGTPDSKLAKEATELVRDTESLLLFHHSSRVYYWG